MSEYVSIKTEVLQKLKDRMPAIRERFGIETLGIFGSVARGEDTEKSDVDVIFTFKKDETTLDRFLGLADYLEDLIKRKVDVIPVDGFSPHILSRISGEVVWIDV